MYNCSKETCLGTVLCESMGYSPCKDPIDTPVSESPPQCAPLVAAARTPHEGTLALDGGGQHGHRIPQQHCVHMDVRVLESKC